MKIRAKACFACRERHIKCNKNNPCSFCKKKKIECQYAQMSPERCYTYKDYLKKSASEKIEKRKAKDQKTKTENKRPKVKKEIVHKEEHESEPIFKKLKRPIKYISPPLVLLENGDYCSLSEIEGPNVRRYLNDIV